MIVWRVAISLYFGSLRGLFIACPGDFWLVTNVRKCLFPCLSPLGASWNLLVTSLASELPCGVSRVVSCTRFTANRQVYSYATSLSAEFVCSLTVHKRDSALYLYCHFESLIGHQFCILYFF